MNPEAAALLGNDPARLIGSPLATLVVEDHRPHVQALVTDPASMPARIEVRLADGFHPVELSISVLPGVPNLLIVGVRSMAREFRLSALAGAELTHDQATSLPNRLHLMAQLHERITAPRSRPLALVGLWIDDLEGLAVSRGDHAVSRVLREVATRIEKRLRGPDLLGRFDESGFLCLLTSVASTGQIKSIAGRLRDEVAFPVEFNDSLVSFTASVAVAQINEDRPTTEQAVNAIEGAAHRARGGTGNQTEVFTLSPPAPS